MGQQWAISGPWKVRTFRADLRHVWAIATETTIGLLRDRPTSSVFFRTKSLSGAAGGDRTHDPWLRRPILYPLSYSRNAELTCTKIRGRRELQGFFTVRMIHAAQRPQFYQPSQARSGLIQAPGYNARLLSNRLYPPAASTSNTRKPSPRLPPIFSFLRTP